MERRDRFRAWEVVVIARRERERGRDQRERERERSLLGFSLMMPVGGRATEMAIRRHSTQAAGGAPMERWFRTRAG
jgi:hypothetical protein